MARQKRADGRYQVQLDVGVDACGKRLRKYFYGQTLTEARRKRDEWLASRNGTSLETVSGWADKWLRTYNARLKESTLRGLTYTVGQVTAWFGDKPLAEVTPVDVQEFVNQFAGMTRVCVERKVNALRSIFETAVDNRIIDTSPVRGVQMPATSRVRGHRALTREERDRVVARWATTGDGEFAMLLMFTGLRAGEACALTWDDIDLDAGTIRVDKATNFRHDVTTPKTDASVRVVPIIGMLREVLARMQARTHTGLVFPTQNGGMYSDAGLSKVWHAYTRRIGVDCTPHDMRDTYATILYDAGVDVKTMQALLGHADVHTTLQVYTKLSEERKTDSIQKLHAYLTANLTATSTHTHTYAHEPGNSFLE